MVYQAGSKRRRSAISEYAKPAHKKAAKLLGYALVLGDFEGWEMASALWAARLSDQERAALAFSALRALDPEQARDVVEAALAGAGMPIAPLFSEMDEAAFWADMATPAELDAYALASFDAMPPHRKRAFLDFVGRAAA